MVIPPTDEPEPGSGTDEARSGRGRRAERRRAAEARNALARRTGPLRREARALEDEIEALEAEKGALERRLADPASYETPDFDAGSQQRSYADLTQRLDERMERWVEVRAALEEAEKAAPE